MAEKPRMNIVPLDDGWQSVPTITEPTHLIARNRWRATLRPPEQGHYRHSVLRVEAPVKLTGLELSGAQWAAISADARFDGLIELEDCWVHSNAGTGIWTGGDVRIHRCLVEANGVNPNMDGGINTDHGNLKVSNSVLRGWDTCDLLSHWYKKNPDAVVDVDQCLLVANRAVWLRGLKSENVKFRRCTVWGNINHDLPDNPITVDPSNWWVDQDPRHVPGASYFVNQRMGLIIPRPSVLQQFKGIGCYDGHPAYGHQRDFEKFWDNGYPYALHGTWQKYPLKRMIMPGEQLDQVEVAP